MNELLVGACSLFVGWVLGILGPLIQSYFDRKYSKDRIQNGILSEIRELKNGVAGLVVVTEMRLGNFSKELLSWCKASRKEGDLPPPLNAMSELIAKLETLDAAAFSKYAERLKMGGNGGLNLRTFELPYLQSKLGDLELFPELVRQRLLELLSRVHIHNQMVEDSKFYYGLTFDSGISEENHASASAQLSGTYRNIAQQGKLLVSIADLAETALRGQ